MLLSLFFDGPCRDAPANLFQLLVHCLGRRKSDGLSPCDSLQSIHKLLLDVFPLFDASGLFGGISLWVRAHDELMYYSDSNVFASHGAYPRNTLERIIRTCDSFFVVHSSIHFNLNPNCILHEPFALRSNELLVHLFDQNVFEKHPPSGVFKNSLLSSTQSFLEVFYHSADKENLSDEFAKLLWSHLRLTQAASAFLKHAVPFTSLPRSVIAATTLLLQGNLSQESFTVYKQGIVLAIAYLSYFSSDTETLRESSRRLCRFDCFEAIDIWSNRITDGSQIAITICCVNIDDRASAECVMFQWLSKYPDQQPVSWRPSLENLLRPLPSWFSVLVGFKQAIRRQIPPEVELNTCIDRAVSYLVDNLEAKLKTTRSRTFIECMMSVFSDKSVAVWGNIVEILYVLGGELFIEGAKFYSILARVTACLCLKGFKNLPNPSLLDVAKSIFTALHEEGVQQIELDLCRRGLAGSLCLLLITKLRPLNAAATSPSSHSHPLPATTAKQPVIYSGLSEIVIGVRLAMSRGWFQAVLSTKKLSFEEVAAKQNYLLPTTSIYKAFTSLIEDDLRSQSSRISFYKCTLFTSILRVVYAVAAAVSDVVIDESRPVYIAAISELLSSSKPAFMPYPQENVDFIGSKNDEKLAIAQAAKFESLVVACVGFGYDVNAFLEIPLHFPVEKSRAPLLPLYMRKLTPPTVPWPLAYLLIRSIPIIAALPGQAEAHLAVLDRVSADYTRLLPPLNISYLATVVVYVFNMYLPRIVDKALQGVQVEWSKSEVERRISSLRQPIIDMAHGLRKLPCSSRLIKLPCPDIPLLEMLSNLETGILQEEERIFEEDRKSVV